MLVGAAVLLAWLAGFAAAGSRAATQRRIWPDLRVAVFHMTEDACPGLALQVIGFAVLLFLR
jgi:hypothetical protein